jgi:hypothetical protein
VLETLLFGNTKQHEDYRTDTVVPDGRKKECIFIKGMKHDYYTEKLIEAINSINLKRYDVYVCMKANNVKSASDMLSKLKKEISYIPITYKVNYTIMDYILCKLRLKFGISIGLTNNRVEKVMKREIRKYFGEAEFDYVLHHSEFDRMVGSMCSLLGTRTIYNFKYFNFMKYKENRAYRKQVRYFISLFPSFTRVVATKEFNELRKKANNILFNEEAVFPMDEILTEVAQHEGRSSNIS